MYNSRFPGKAQPSPGSILCALQPGQRGAANTSNALYCPGMQSGSPKGVRNETLTSDKG